MTNTERIEAVAWIAKAMNTTYGKLVAALPRADIRKGYRLYLTAKKSNSNCLRPVPEKFLTDLQRERGM